MSDSQSDAEYFQEVVAEIELEARRRAASGEYPRALLRSLDEEFRRWIPDASLESGIEDTIRSVEAASYVDAAVPLKSRSPVGSFTKWVVRRLTYFYHRHITQQITALGIHITRPLRLIDASLKNINRRLSLVEDQLDVGAAARSELIAGVSHIAASEGIKEILLEHFRGVPGRVLFGDLFEPSLLDFLRNQGVDIYGVTPNDEAAAAVDIQQAELIEHLDHLDRNALDGFVLCGITDRSSLNEQLRALRLLLLRSRAGARAAIIVAKPELLLSRLGPVATDLLQGRPLHSETWCYLLSRENASDITVVESSDSACLLITATLP